ncbi:hypothetical protein [Dactylosporangium sp. CA-139066]|uniref:hypothetical protein n=1 Tax=Dactylosporangium sp. CA-139066 TaxID=3239930 RepID=UPI003D92B7B0
MSILFATVFVSVSITVMPRNVATTSFAPSGLTASPPNVSAPVEMVARERGTIPALVPQRDNFARTANGYSSGSTWHLL